MKKLLATLGALTISSVGVANVISCTTPTEPTTPEEVEVKEIAKFDSFVDFFKMQLKKSGIFKDWSEIEKKSIIVPKWQWFDKNATREKNMQTFWFKVERARSLISSYLNLREEQFRKDYFPSNMDNSKINDNVFYDKDGDETFSYMRKHDTYHWVWENYRIIYPKYSYTSEDGIETIEQEDYSKFDGVRIQDNESTYETFIQKGYLEVRVYESSLFWNLKPNVSGFESFFIAEGDLINEENGFAFWFDPNQIPEPNTGDE